MNRILLACFAHPDDEAFGTGGTIAQYASLGYEVVLVCATRGEVGEISDPSLATPETLGEVREGELRCAADTMGVRELIFLDYRDSGMAGSAENNDPRAFINAPAQRVVEQLVRIIRRVKPQVVITFEPNGGYGHPDHICIHQHTVTAFHAARDGRQFPDLGNPWGASRLFYTAIPRSFFKQMRKYLEMSELNMDQFQLLLQDGMGWPDEQVHVTIITKETIDAKWAALECHRTQFGPGNLFRLLPEEITKELMSKEYFSLAWPEPGPGLHLTGLFDAIGDAQP